jgi:Carboxypeptidase regulatory-like domain
MRCDEHPAARNVLPLTAVLLLIAAVSGLLAQQPRDNSAGAHAGSALIAGRVVTRDVEGRPLRKAIVAVTSDDARVHRTAITDDRGGFAFDGLPVGRYEILASRRGWPSISYGASRPHQPGTRINLADGQRMVDITVRMPRGAILTGSIVDQSGHPLAQSDVVALRLVYEHGERRFTRYAVSTTDDRGVYRLYGLAAGDYAVATTSAVPEALRAVDLIYPSDSVDVTRSVSALRGYARPADGSPILTTVGYAPVYYPGTSFRSQAVLVSVGAGEERAGLDFEVAHAQTLSLQGTVHAPRDVPRQAVTVTLRASIDDATGGYGADERQTVASRDGRFTFPRVPPGRYELAARVTQSGVTALWGETGVTVAGDHAPALLLSLRPALTLSGHVRFEGDSATPSASQIRLSLEPLFERGGAVAAVVGAAGDFTIGQLVPGRYRIVSTIVGTRGGSWALKSAVVNGGDALDAPLEIRASSSGALVRFGDRPANLSGSVLNAAGQPEPEQFVVLFSTNPRLWFPMSRRIRAVRPASDGRYEVDNLAPGEYFVITVKDIDDGEWFDREWLQRRAGSSARISIAEGNRLVRDFRTE